MPKPPVVNHTTLVQRWRRKSFLGLFGALEDHRKDGPAVVQQPAPARLGVFPIIAGRLTASGLIMWMYRGEPHRRNGPSSLFPTVAEWRILDVSWQKQNLLTGEKMPETWVEEPL